MKLNNIKNIITDKWHFCQRDTSLFDEVTPIDKVDYTIVEKPTKPGLYLVYMWDYFYNPKFHYEILELKNLNEFAHHKNVILKFKRIGTNLNSRNEGYIDFNCILKWMEYEEFTKLIE